MQIGGNFVNAALAVDAGVAGGSLEVAVEQS